MNIAQTVLDIAMREALKMMAAKADCSVDDIKACVLADPTGNTARYLATLIAAAITNVPYEITRGQA